MSENVSIATQGGGTVTAQKRAKNCYGGQSVNKRKDQPSSAKVWETLSEHSWIVYLTCAYFNTATPCRCQVGLFSR